MVNRTALYSHHTLLPTLILILTLALAFACSLKLKRTVLLRYHSFPLFSDTDDSGRDLSVEADDGRSSRPWNRPCQASPGC